MNRHPNRMVIYMEHACGYDFSSLCFPVSLSSIAPFAARNNLSINVYGVEDEKKVNGDQHYSTIKNCSRLISGQLSNHGHVTYCCKKCLRAYSTKELLAAHAVDCCHVQRKKVPLGPRCHFTNIQKQLAAPFVVYTDFESILKPVNEGVDVTQGVSTGTASSTTVYHEHVPCSFAYKVVSNVDPDFSQPLVMYRGEDAADKFARDLQKEAKQLCEEYIATPKTMIFSTAYSLSFTNATTCHICTKPLAVGDRVRDHCHITEIYRGDAHSDRLLSVIEFVTTVILLRSTVVLLIVLAI